MRKNTIISICLCLFYNSTLLFSQIKINGNYIANLGATHIDTSNIDLIDKIEIESFNFKFKKQAIKEYNEFIILFTPSSPSNRVLVKENAIEEIKNKKRLRFIIDLYQINDAMPKKVDTLYIEFKLKGPFNLPLLTADTIQANPIKIINDCPQFDSIRFEQVNIVGNYLQNKTAIRIAECDTIYYPIEINIDPPDAIIIIDGKKDSIHTKYVLSKNIKSSLNITIIKKGYLSHSEVIRNLKPNDINRFIINLISIQAKKNNEIWIFGGTAVVYALIWYGFQTKDNLPPKIPSPRNLPK